uniref:Adenylate kinase 7a n=1 Tax=Sander lucioperca TaxID=283035 RepID=A0A8C9X2P5_SANLU
PKILASKMGDTNKRTRPKRIFVNDVDRYSSEHIAKVTLANSPTRDELLGHLLECDVVVYNISESATQQQIEDATWAITALHDEMGNFKSRKMFILVSSVMTWAMTKPQNPEETDVMLTEEEFRRKRPHPSFKNHNNLEKLVLKLVQHTQKYSNSMVAVTQCNYFCPNFSNGKNRCNYENTNWKNVAWLMQFPKVPLFGQGTNHIPMIHVYDLGGVIQNIIELKPKSKYVLAVDDSKNTLEDIVKMISATLGPGTINKLSEQDAISMKAFKPEELEYLNINLRLDAFIIKDSFSLRWKSEAGMVENMASIVEEYRDTRQLLPIRVCLVGPPAVGKTTVAEKLCSHYKIHHIKIKEVVEEKIAQLVGIVNEGNPENVSEEEVAAAQKELELFNTSREINGGRLADHLVFDILQKKLNSKPCTNQGFVLDGFPKTYEQAKLIFSDEDMENQDLMPEKPLYNKNITPEHVFALNATDYFLTKRVLGLPQSVAEEKHYTQEEFVPRLTRYRQLSTAEETLLDYFDELEIHPEHIGIFFKDTAHIRLQTKITEMVGIPKNYGLSPEEQEEEDRKKEEERMQKVAAEAAEKKRRNEAALAEMAAQYEEWQKNLSEVKRQEHDLLEAHALPLRNYLMKNVMPSLTEAMLECSKIKPEDPVDFLAEHLLRNNQKE